MSNNTNISSTSTASPSALSINATSQQSSSSDSSMTTLLTFGPLSSCLDLPNLSATTLPHDTTTSSQLQTWLTSLPSTTTCTPLSWTVRPDYSTHIDAVMSFQSQLLDLFPPSSPNATLNANASTPGSTFFPNTTSSIFSNPSSAGTLPQTLPLWIGVTIAVATLVNAFALVLHIFADLDALFPSLARKLAAEPEALPQHHANDTATTIVEEKGEVEGGEKVEPPQYTAPAVTPVVGGGGLEETPALMRISRKVKKLAVPLLLVSALGLVGVAVVLNGKFAVGPVGTGGAAASSPMLNGTSSIVAAPATTANNSSISTASSTPRSTPRSNPAVATATSATRIDEGVRNATTSSIVPIETSSGMVRLVRRQTNFFPTPSVSSLVSSTTTPAAVSTLAPLATSSSATASTATIEPNASLFPPTTTSTATFPSAAPTSITTSSSPPTPPPAPTAAASNPNASAAAPPSPLVLQRSDSTHRIWWIIMLDFVLWFAQRRRTRSQTALDRAKALVVRQLGGGGGALEK